MTPPPSERHMAGHLLGGRYTLLTPIAQGGMGEVWKARDSQTGRMVAAKVLRPELSGEELSLSRLRIEARNAMRVQHPNIASVLDSGEEDGRGWIVMELVDGRALTDYLRGGTRIAVEDLVPVVIQVALALDAAAAAGVVHRDIKPANILIRPDGVVKLTDFGISRTTDQASLTAAGMVMGTAQYLPPEQAMGETATSSGDLYALGVIAYEAAAGRRPFTGTTQVDIAFSHVNDPVPALPEDVPVPFAKVVTHLLQKDPHHRPATGAALVRELVTAARTLDIPIEPHPLPLPTQDDAPTPTSGTGRPALAPVLHERRRVLPEEMLRPPTPDEGGRRTPGDAGRAGPAGDVGTTGPAGDPVGHGPGDTAADDTADGTADATAGAAEHATAGAGDGRGAPPAGGTRRWHRLASAAPVSGGQSTTTHSTAPSATPPATPPATTSAAASPAPADGNTTATRPHARHAGVSGDTPRSGRTAVGTGRGGGTPDPPGRPGRRAPVRSSGKERTTGKQPVTRRPLATRHDSRRDAREHPRIGTDAQPGWHPLRHGSVMAADTPHRRPPRTRFNRSVVAPPVPLVELIGRWVVIGLIVLTVILIAVATIQNRFGSLTSLMGMGAHVIEEARTCPIPWTTV